MSLSTDIRVIGARLYFIPIRNRVPLKFGSETVTSVTCARACVRVADRAGRQAEGWGETPLSVTWVWPSRLSYEARLTVLKRFCAGLAEAWAAFPVYGHPIEIGHDFLEQALRRLWHSSGEPGPGGDGAGAEPGGAKMPWLGALVCNSVFDQAIHDAYGMLHERPVYSTYTRKWIERDLSRFLEPAAGADVEFRNRFPADYLVFPRAEHLPAWHLVGGLDPVDASELTGEEPSDDYPVLLADWIRRDGLQCLKVKLRGTDAEWDYQRMVKVGRMGLAHGTTHLSADFNCTVTEPAYVNGVLDRLKLDEAQIFGRILYVEQPFPYELEANRIDVRTVSGRKPLFLDESAHDWRMIRLGRELGWTGVALKTCKTQTGALLSACWARAHGMQLMVQDLTNPMLAQVPHAQLAAHAGTIMGVETNSMQFYPEASGPEAAVHPGLYRRRDGSIDLSSVAGPGFGYRLSEIRRELPDPAADFA